MSEPFEHAAVLGAAGQQIGLGADEDDATRRLIELIDELYDRRVNVIVSAAAPAESLYQGKRLQLDFQRLISRMHEFASWDYIALTHRP